MTLEEFLHAPSRLIASVQADEGNPLSPPEMIGALALSSLKQPLAGLRIEGVANIEAVRAVTDVPIIGLIKREYSDSRVMITASLNEVNELLASPCDIIALDATLRVRPEGQQFNHLVKLIRSGGKLVMADCDSIVAVQQALSAGVDLISTTLSGYTYDSPLSDEPDIELIREASNLTKTPIIAEGRFVDNVQILSAMRAGAWGVVIGGALNDPVKQTKRLGRVLSLPKPVMGVDIGGSWLRAGLFDADWNLVEKQKVVLPNNRADRISWIRGWALKWQVSDVGISTGGTVDPSNCSVIESSDLIPENLGTDYRAELPSLNVTALNDGLATAWAHAMHQEYAGKRVATLALGTGVGFGFVDRGRLDIGLAGAYARLNDVPYSNQMVEAAIAAGDTEAVEFTLALVHGLFRPEHLIVAGSRGINGTWKAEHTISPFGEDAGLYGAAAIAKWSPF